MRHLFCGFFALFFLSVAQGEPSIDALKKIHKNLRATVQNLKQEKLEPNPTISRIRVRLMALTEQIRDHDKDITQTQHQLNALEKKRKDTENALVTKDKDLMKSLRLIQRFSRVSSAEHLLSQAHPQDVVHSAILLKSLQRYLHQETATLRQELDALALQKQDLVAKKAATLKSLEVITTEADQLMGELKGERQKAEERLERLMLQPSNLESLLDALERLDDPLIAKVTGKPKMVKTGILKTAEGNFTFPIMGQVVSKFEGEGVNAQDGRPLNKGIMIETAAGELLESPFDGAIVFSGPFLRYGQLLIVEHKSGYHALLAGMGTVKKKVGDRVKAGDFLATMPVTTQVPPRLYLELRKKGVAIDPLLKFKSP